MTTVFTWNHDFLQLGVSFYAKFPLNISQQAFLFFFLKNSHDDPLPLRILFSPALPPPPQGFLKVTEGPFDKQIGGEAAFWAIRLAITFPPSRPLIGHSAGFQSNANLAPIN